MRPSYRPRLVFVPRNDAFPRSRQHLIPASPPHRVAPRNRTVFSGGPSDFNPGVPSAKAVTSSKMLAEMIGRQKRSIRINKRMYNPFPGNRVTNDRTERLGLCVSGRCAQP